MDVLENSGANEQLQATMAARRFETLPRFGRYAVEPLLTLLESECGGTVSLDMGGNLLDDSWPIRYKGGMSLSGTNTNCRADTVNAANVLKQLVDAYLGTLPLETLNRLARIP